MSFSLSLYHSLPSSTKSIVASLRGYYLNWWRYDSQTEKLVDEILERDYWNDEQWKKWQEERLSFILHRAATKVPYYRKQWQARRRKGDKSSWEYLENWQLLEKQTLKNQAIEFIAEDCNPKKMYRDNTSGTTGTSLNIWSKAETIKLWYAIFEARSRRWYGITRKDRWAILGGQLVTPIKQKSAPFWVWNAGLNQLYMSSYHLAPDLIGSYLEALLKYKVRYILGYSSALYSLAKEINRQKRKDIKLDIAITNAEPLYSFQKAEIAEAFNCPVRETYGMAEMSAAAGECERGRLHQWSDVGIIEKTKSDNCAPIDFICTGLINPDMPLIRYKIGDCGVFSDQTCDCRRTLPLIEKIEGRTDDVLYTADGRRIGRLDPVFKNSLPIIEAQLIQNSLDQLIVKYVPDHGFNKNNERELTSRIQERMGDVKVTLEEVTEIPRTKRGKFRAVVCNLSKEEKLKISE